MRKLITSIVFALIGLLSYAQTYNSYPVIDAKDIRSTAVFYSIPKTEIVFRVKVDKITQKKGIYYKSAHLLGLKNVISSDETRYKITDIEITTRPVLDSRSLYVLNLKKGVKVNKSEYNTLEEILIGDKEFAESPRAERKSYRTSKKSNPGDALIIPTKPYYEKVLLERGQLEAIDLSPEEVVSKIRSLKERQIDILSGEVDGTYLNTSVDFMYKQLDEIIDSYVSLFTGVQTKEEEVYEFSLMPEKPIIAEEDLMMKLCSFSETQGFLNPEISTDLPPIMVRFHTFNSTRSFRRIDQESTKNIGVYYSVPEKVRVSIEHNNKTYSNTVDINQYGTIQGLSTKNANIKFDPKYGSIIAID